MNGWGVQSFDRLRMKGKGLRMMGCSPWLRGGVQSFDRLRMRGGAVLRQAQGKNEIN